MPRGESGTPTTPDTALPPEQSLTEAQRLVDSGQAFHAHEVLEGTWKAAPPAERELWRGLAQIAVGLTHARRGNPSGAVALLRRAAERIEPYAQDPPYSVDAAGLVGWARALAARVESAGLDGVTDPELIPRLRT